MKKILLSFSVIIAFAVFATFTRRNVGIGADRFLSPSVSVLGNSQATTSNGPVYVPKRNIDSGVSDDDTQTIPPQTLTEPTTTTKPAGQFKDGTYVGIVTDAYYGNIQVQAVIKSGKLSDVVFLQYPNDRSTSIQINTQAMPYLKSEAIQIQSGNVNIVSGATDTSIAFRQSMNSALDQAKI